MKIVRSNDFIQRVISEFPKKEQGIKEQLHKIRSEHTEPSWIGLENIKQIQQEFSIPDINHIKPGVGETTRVLLRRVPWKILVQDKNDPRLKHIMLLAKDRSVPIEEYKNMSYTCCGLIKTMRS